MLRTWVQLWYLGTDALGGTPQPGQLVCTTEGQNVASKGCLLESRSQDAGQGVGLVQGDSGFRAGPRRRLKPTASSLEPEVKFPTSHMLAPPFIQ